MMRYEFLKMIKLHVLEEVRTTESAIVGGRAQVQLCARTTAGVEMTYHAPSWEMVLDCLPAWMLTEK